MDLRERVAAAKLLDLNVNSSKLAVADCVGRSMEGLTVPEQIMLNAIPEEFRKSVLDIGIGAGRTTGPLSQAFGKYVGIDVAEPSLAFARQRFPRLDLRREDARTISYEDEFSCVFFSFNGIDLVSFKDRQLIFSNVRKALRSGGYFIYSTHSLMHENVKRWLEQFLIYELKLGKGRLPVSVRKLWNRSRFFWSGQVDWETGIGILNDPALEFGMLMAYVDPSAEMLSLRKTGFETLMAVGEKKSQPGFDAEDMWVYFLNRKSP